DQRSAATDCRHGFVERSRDDYGDGVGDCESQWSDDDVSLRLRDVDELRFAGTWGTGCERRVEYDGAVRIGKPDSPGDGYDLPLPARGDEPVWDDQRVRPYVYDHPAAECRHGFVERGRDDYGDGVGDC